MFSKTFFREARLAPESLVYNRKFDLALRPFPPQRLKHLVRNHPDLLECRVLLYHHTADTILSAREAEDMWPTLLGDVLRDSDNHISYSAFREDPTSFV